MNIETANRLMQYRKKAGLSQEELAEKLGVSRQAVSKWECSESSPDTDNLIALAKIYGVTLDELLNCDVDAKKEESEPKKEFDESQGIHIKDKDGSEVHITNKGIHIVDNEDTVDINPKEMKEEFVDKAVKTGKFFIFETIICSSLTFLCVLAYLLCGFLIKDGLGWRNYWVVFFLIPIVPTIFAAIRKRSFVVFNYPVFIVMAYLTVGMFLDIWHPTWIAFLTIPLYYTVFGTLERKLKNSKSYSKKKDVIDNEESDD